MNLDSAVKAVDKRIALTGEKGGVMFRRLSRDSALRGGKRLRARIFFIFAGDAGEESVGMAAAVELLHAATLVHDDIIDNASTRRGRPALCRERGVKTGLLYGDYLFSSAFSIAAHLPNGFFMANNGVAYTFLIACAAVSLMMLGTGRFGVTKKY
jgi:geranylgeranyl pyrophosphate synthase